MGSIKKIMIVLGVAIFVALLVEGLLLVRLSRQRAAYKKYWALQAQEMAPEHALIYVALGDSTAVGIGASSPENGYVGKLAKSLESKTNRPVHVINLGVTGAKLSDVISTQLPQLNKLVLPNDAVITLGIGSNDVRQFDATTFRHEFEQIAQVLPRQTVVADVPYFGGGRANAKESSAIEASTIIQELTTQHNYQLVHLHEATKARDSWRNYAVDFFHPNNKSYIIWADAFWSTIEHQI